MTIERIDFAQMSIRLHQQYMISSSLDYIINFGMKQDTVWLAWDYLERAERC